MGSSNNDDDDLNRRRREEEELTIELAGVVGKKDCLACRIVGSGGMFAIATYVFMNARKNQNKLNRLFINLVGSGKISYL